MADLETSAPATGTDGQAAADSTGTTATAPAAPAGQATASTEDSFFDPSSIPPELQTAYKSMQGSYTRKMQEISNRRKELDSVAAFKSGFDTDPIGTLTRLAQQHGLSISRAEQQAQDNLADWTPNSWDEVLSKAEMRAQQAIMEKLSPILGNVREMKVQSVESQLDQIDPMWRDHEDRMREVLSKHPTLANDLPTLYEMSIPAEVRESKYTQKALAKIRGIDSATRVSGPSTKPKAAPAAPNVTDFNSAVEAARRRLVSGE